jgi:hypothetical protein
MARHCIAIWEVQKITKDQNRKHGSNFDQKQSTNVVIRV